LIRQEEENSRHAREEIAALEAAYAQAVSEYEVSNYRWQSI
jgi:hypothetical protein